MPNSVIIAERLGKNYLIGHQNERERYTALRDVLTRNVKSVLNKTRQLLSGQQLLAGDEIEEFWALKDLDFEIKRGERVGIIGRNGAGKSTLLKILSRITEPSTGRVEIRGRVASLLEVGTGFHPELTGRENIYLNGAILGMTRAEIKEKFDEIVDFAGVEKFLDTPVKRYSSGMYVRLAFAVAAHLEPEILVVDEVLAVGDAEFQKKCLGKMEDVSKNEGRTVLFVSHNMGLISKLCNKSIFLQNGEIIFNGETNPAINLYLQNSKQYEEFTNNVKTSPRIEKAYLSGLNNKSQNEFGHSDKIMLNLEIINSSKKRIDLGIAVLDKFKVKVFTSIIPNSLDLKKEEVSIILCEIPENFLAPGKYSLDIAVFNGKLETYEYISDILPFSIIDNGSELAMYEDTFYGNVIANCTWKIG